MGRSKPAIRTADKDHLNEEQTLIAHPLRENHERKGRVDPPASPANQCTVAPKGTALNVAQGPNSPSKEAKAIPNSGNESKSQIGKIPHRLSIQFKHTNVKMRPISSTSGTRTETQIEP